MIRQEVYTRGTFAARKFIELCSSIQPSQDYITGKKAKKIKQCIRIYEATQQEFNLNQNKKNKL